jgi:hypothetical protein
VKLLDSFATRPGTVRADPARNILLIQGPRGRYYADLLIHCQILIQPMNSRPTS